MIDASGDSVSASDRMYLPHDCDEMRLHVEDSRIPIEYYPRFREYSLPLIAGHTAWAGIGYCPWCGTELPKSLRGRFFDELEPHDVDIMTEDSDLPAEYRDDTWWRRHPT